MAQNPLEAAAASMSTPQRMAATQSGSFGAKPGEMELEAGENEFTVEIIDGGFKVNGQMVQSPEEVHAALDQFLQSASGDTQPVVAGQ